MACRPHSSRRPSVSGGVRIVRGASVGIGAHLPCVTAARCGRRLGGAGCGPADLPDALAEGLSASLTPPPWVASGRCRVGRERSVSLFGQDSVSVRWETPGSYVVKLTDPADPVPEELIRRRVPRGPSMADSAR